jgi:hypothetical protein
VARPAYPLEPGQREREAAAGPEAP